MKTNLHTHTVWCDGSDTVEDVVLSAIDKGFDAIGFSSHMAFPRATPWEVNCENALSYVGEVREMAEKYASKIRVLCGGEADYIKGFTTPEKMRYQALGLDYLIGSVHTVVAPDGEYVHVDHSVEILSEGLSKHYGGDAKAFIQDYFASQREMLVYDFDIIAHPDLVRKFNTKAPYFDESAAWYVKELELTAEAIASSGKIVEVNTGAISRGWLEDAYPSPLFRKFLRERGVRFILSSDSHQKETVDCAFDKFAAAEAFIDPLAAIL